MTASTTTAESDAYLAAVRVELDDLPEEERTDLLEDLAQHLADMEAERMPGEAAEPSGGAGGAAVAPAAPVAPDAPAAPPAAPS